MTAPRSRPTLGQQFTLAAHRPSTIGSRVVRTFGVRRAPSPDVHERARLLDAAGPDAARAMQLEAAADEAHAVREQRGGERVAAKSGERAAVEREGERVRAVDEHRRPGLRGVNFPWSRQLTAGGGSVMAYTASTACVTVWRATLNH